MFCGIKSSNMLFFGTDTGPQSFCHSFIDTLFEVSPEIRCSGV